MNNSESNTIEITKVASSENVLSNHNSSNEETNLHDNLSEKNVPNCNILSDNLSEKNIPNYNMLSDNYDNFNGLPLRNPSGSHHDSNSNDSIDEYIKHETDHDFDAKPSIVYVKPKIKYWGVFVNMSKIMYLELNFFLQSKPELRRLNKIYSTLLFVGKKNDRSNELYYEQNRKRLCKLNISGFGWSDAAVVLKVSNITFLDTGLTVQSHNPVQRITIAVSKKLKKIDAIQILNGNFVSAPIEFIGELNGGF